MEETKNKDFTVIFEKLETKDSQEILQLTKEVKAIVTQVEEQKDDLEKIVAVSTDPNHMYLFTGI